jgi:hypothetical protein
VRVSAKDACLFAGPGESIMTKKNGNAYIRWPNINAAVPVCGACVRRSASYLE